ncbi:hypothetical protein STRCR_1386 [Streptococcus criceti HS-6]|uniref:Uncharacterized protein n=1 Tax=Streptococcus criceti HS-6 TaxID=873449 RepID=G5JN51_STRCG|nr:hypothetical protein STRCR_1386 [Streptococcus criceti HS-6]
MPALGKKAKRTFPLLSRRLKNRLKVAAVHHLDGFMKSAVGLIQQPLDLISVFLAGLS